MWTQHRWQLTSAWLVLTCYHLSLLSSLSLSPLMHTSLTFSLIVTFLKHSVCLSFYLWVSFPLFYLILIYTVHPPSPLFMGPPYLLQHATVICSSMSDLILLHILIPAAKINPSWLWVIKCQMLFLTHCEDSFLIQCYSNHHTSSFCVLIGIHM